MRVVLDTNVLVSGLLTAKGPCARILDKVGAGELEVVYSSAILIEYLRVLQLPRLALPPEHVDGLLHLIEQDGWLVEPVRLEPLRDPTDTKFLEAAVAGNAAYLVTGNLRDYPKSPFRGVKIAGPRDFLTEGLGS